MSSYVYRNSIKVREMQEIMMGMGGVQDTPEYPVGWTQLTDFPYGRIYSHASTIIGDELYVFGGYINAARSNRTFKLHIPTYTWSEVITTNTPTTRAACSLVTINGLLCMYGGSSGGNQCWQLNPTTKVWTQRATGINSTNHKATTYSGKMIVVGGSGPTAAQTVRIYDPVANSWSLGTPFSSTIYSQGMDLFGDEIWMYGGKFDGWARDYLLSYSILNDAWTTHSSSPPVKEESTFINLNGIGFSYGGYPISEKAHFKRLELPSTWTQLTDAPVSRFSHTATAWQGKMIIIGGSTLNETGIRDVWLYNPG